MKKHPPIAVNLEDEVLLFGEVYSMDMQEAEALKLKLQKRSNISKGTVLKHYNTFYKETAIEYIVPKVEHFSQVMGLSYNEIRFRKMKSRWGSCTSKRVLTFNTELIKVKKELVDYVIVHELAHLKHMNHSREFHSLVQEYLPYEKQYRKELRNIKIATF